MKKIFTLLAFVSLFTFGAQAQIPNGSIAPDWTLTDINGNEHHLYSYLDSGYTVVIDFSATWCGPCWSYHTSGALEELYINHGPAGMANVSETTTDDVMVFFIEGDDSTTSDDLNGTGSNTQGNWVANTPYPIIDDASMTAAYQIGYWPTIYTICPNRIINVSGQITTESHYALANYCQVQSLEYQAVNTSASSILGVASNTEFTFDITNEGEGAEDLRLTLGSNAPADWSGSISSDASTAGDGSYIDVTVTAGQPLSITIDAVPGSTPFLADYIVDIESLTNPDNVHLYLKYNVISGITDIVVDNGDVATQWNDMFVAGLESANNTTHGVISIDKFIEGINNDQLGEVGHVYYNVAWTFPSLTDDGVAALSTFMDNGGNVMFSSQDMGWDTWNNDGTSQTQDFFTNYLKADFQADGSASNSQLNWNPDDAMYSTAQNSAIVNIYGGNNIYPDEIDPIAPALPIFHYNNNTSKTGGIRLQQNGYKMVYIGIDLAMIDDETARNQAMQITHDWFHGLITGVEFDESFGKAIGNNFPNPATDFTVIPFENLQENITLRVVNALGKVVLEESIPKGTTAYRLNTSALSTGLYQCVLVNNQGVASNLSLEIVK